MMSKECTYPQSPWGEAALLQPGSCYPPKLCLTQAFFPSPPLAPEGAFFFGPALGHSSRVTWGHYYTVHLHHSPLFPDRPYPSVDYIQLILPETDFYNLSVTTHLPVLLIPTVPQALIISQLDAHTQAPQVLSASSLSAVPPTFQTHN